MGKDLIVKQANSVVQSHVQNTTDLQDFLYMMRISCF